MPKQTVEPIPITLAGKSYALLYDYNAVADLEDEYDLAVSVMECLSGRKLSLALIRGLLAAGLAHDPKTKMDRRRAGALINDHMSEGGSLGEVAGVIVRALVASGVFGPQSAEGDAKNGSAPGAAEGAPATSPESAG